MPTEDACIYSMCIVVDVYKVCLYFVGGVCICSMFILHRIFLRIVYIICVYCRGVLHMVHIDRSITLLRQYSLLSLVNTHINISKNSITGVAHILSIFKSISLQGHASLFLLHSKRKEKMRQDPHKIIW